MVVFAHWIPPAIAPKRYATWFFAAPVDDDDVMIDDGEIVEMSWATPAAVLAKHHDGEIEIVPPTWVTLDTLTGHDTVASLLKFLDERPARHHATKVARAATSRRDVGRRCGLRRRRRVDRRPSPPPDHGTRRLCLRGRRSHPVSDALTGLTSADVAERVADGRTNDVPDAPVRSNLQIIQANVLTPVNGIISTLFVLILVAGYPADALFAGVVVSNSVIGIAQEFQARRTLNELAVLSAPRPGPARRRHHRGRHQRGRGRRHP